jgi:phenylacetic acid degradation operon negative regulatory protein
MYQIKNTRITITCMHRELSQAARLLVTRFKSQRPLRAGSLIVTLFGDSILPRGGSVALGSLIKLAAPFGINERLVRTAASRLVHDGWLRARRVGKLSEYHLSAVGRERFAEATQRIYSAPTADWPGRWTLVVLPGMRGAKRRPLRDELTWLGFGEFVPGVFAHPELSEQTLARVKSLGKALAAGASPIVFEANLHEDDAAQRLVSLGWDLKDLSEGYRRFVQRFAPVLKALEQPPAGDQHAVQEQAAFVARTLLIHEYRKLHLRDPLLPARLLSPHWAGTRAAECCRDIYFGVFDASERYLHQVGATLSGALPPAEPKVLQRFGGLTGAAGLERIPITDHIGARECASGGGVSDSL